MSSTGLPSRLAAALAYLGWWMTGLIFWSLERRDDYVRFHAAQAVAAFAPLALLIAGLTAAGVVSLTFMPDAFVPLIWSAGVLTLLAMVLWAVLLCEAARGRMVRVPIAARLAERMGGKTSRF